MDNATVLIIRGLLSITLGIVAIFWPGVTLAVLVLLFGAYVFLDGVVNIVLALTASREGSRFDWVQALLGVVGIAAGVVAFFVPNLTLLVLVMFIAAWAIIRGVLEIYTAVRLRRVIHDEWMIGVSGALSIVFGILVFAFPAAGALTIAWLLGIFLLATGLVLVFLGIRLRRPLAA